PRPGRRPPARTNPSRPPSRLRTCAAAPSAYSYCVESWPVIRQYWLQPPRIVALPAPMAMDLRRRIVGAVESGSTIRGAAQRFAVSPSAAVKLMPRVRATGSAAPARYGGHRRPVLEPHEADLRALVEATPDLTLAEMQTARQRRCGLRAGLSTIHNTLRRIGLRHKKSLRAAEQDRPDGAGERRRWRVWQRFMDPARFVVLDETATAPESNDAKMLVERERPADVEALDQGKAGAIDDAERLIGPFLCDLATAAKILRGDAHERDDAAIETIPEPHGRPAPEP
ncbi:MAG: helix-turn-helix domain-containing protein, partial [Geminicoccaceae bacterium]